MKKPVKERVIEQPCCGCILFRECGTITRTAPDNCKKRMTVEEFVKIRSVSCSTLFYNTFN